MPINLLYTNLSLKSAIPRQAKVNEFPSAFRLNEIVAWLSHTNMKKEEDKQESLDLQQYHDDPQDLIGRPPKWLGLLSVVLSIGSLVALVILGLIVKCNDKSLFDILSEPALRLLRLY